jgi:hypothetical protein
MASPRVSNITPIVRTFRRAEVLNPFTGQRQITRIIGYGLCTNCGNRVSSIVGAWSKSGVVCSKCHTLTYYVKAQWRAIPLIEESEPIEQYFNNGAQPDLEPTPAIQPQLTDLLMQILDQLTQLNKKWS